MDALFSDFSRAITSNSGYQLAATLSPIAPSDHKSYLNELWESTCQRDARQDIKRAIDHCPARSKLDNNEASGWLEVYLAYCKAIGDVVGADTGARVSSASESTDLAGRYPVLIILP